MIESIVVGYVRKYLLRFLMVVVALSTLFGTNPLFAYAIIVLMLLMQISISLISIAEKLHEKPIVKEGPWT